MQMRRAIALLVVAGVAWQAATAATVRGKLVRGNGVAVGVQVTVLNTKTNVRTSPVQSGKDGMYYIPNVPAGAGVYRLEIWPTPNQPPLTVDGLTVKEPETDFNPVAVP